MNSPDTTSFKATVERLYGWPRTKVVLAICGFWSVLLCFTWKPALWILAFRLLLIGYSVLTVFGLFEVGPSACRPGWRWALQVFMVAAIVPIAVSIGYQVTTIGLDPPWYKDKERLEGVFLFVFMGMLIAPPWASVAALLKIRNEAERQALAFDLEKEPLRTAGHANAHESLCRRRYNHISCSTPLANVRELVATGSPNAPKVPRQPHRVSESRRAASERAAGDHGAGKSSWRALYLEVMHMRMPDRLQYSMHVDEEAKSLRCPPMTLFDAGGKRHAPRHRPDRGRRTHRRAGARRQRLLLRAGDRYRARPIHGSGGLGTGLANLKE